MIGATLGSRRHGHRARRQGGKNNERRRQQDCGRHREKNPVPMSFQAIPRSPSTVFRSESPKIKASIKASGTIGPRGTTCENGPGGKIKCGRGKGAQSRKAGRLNWMTSVPAG